MSDVPSSPNKVQIEGITARAAGSESVMQEIGALANYCRDLVSPVGTILHSMLTEAQIQTQMGTGWILADGRAVPDSAYLTLTAFANVPDLRGVFLRGKNHARSTATGNPLGDLALGAYQADVFKLHSHGTSTADFLVDAPPSGTIEKDEGSEYRIELSATSTGQTGDINETRPRNVTVNIFIRIN